VDTERSKDNKKQDSENDLIDGVFSCLTLGSTGDIVASSLFFSSRSWCHFLKRDLSDGIGKDISLKKVRVLHRLKLSKSTQGVDDLPTELFINMVQFLIDCLLIVVKLFLVPLILSKVLLPLCIQIFLGSLYLLLVLDCLIFKVLL
jgi:hypothetical protein